MIDHLLAHGADPAAERDLLGHLVAHVAAVRASPRQSGASPATDIGSLQATAGEGAVFGKPITLIWEAIQWAMVQIQPLLSRDLDVVVNGRDLGARLPRETILAPVRARGGAILSFNRAGEPSIQR